MYILGVNSVYHDPSACLVKDGRILAAMEEERFPGYDGRRVKHGKVARVDNPDHVPLESIRQCLKIAGIDGKEVRHIGYSFDPEERLRKNMSIPGEENLKPGSWGTEEGERIFYTHNLLARDRLLELFPEAEFHFIPHHFCHAASAYFAGPFEESAILSIDGIGEFTSTWLGYGEGNRIHNLSEISYPNSLGFLWERISELLGFDPYEGPGKVMGLGGITDPIGTSGIDYHQVFLEFLRLTEDGFEIDNTVTRFRTCDFSGLERFFGKKRPYVIDRHEEASIASGLQAVTNDVFLHLAQILFRKVNRQREEKIRNLCMAGGVALNCVANAQIYEHGPFDDLWVQPAANDAGTAIGAALYIYHEILGGEKEFAMRDAYLGPLYTESEIEEALKESGLVYRKIDRIEKKVAELLRDGKVIAWFQERMEFGPRALGNRSILTDPSFFNIKEILNKKVKEREYFRPFAPSVLEEEAPDYFNIRSDKLPLAARYMLLALGVKGDRLYQHFPAVIQQNGITHLCTSRIQSVGRDENPRYRTLIEEFKVLSGLGMILNTSFNRQEPIVCTPQDAINTFKNTCIDCLAIADYLVEK